jgi:hypothetical protein
VIIEPIYQRLHSTSNNISIFLWVQVPFDTMEFSALKSLLDATGQAHVYEQTGCLDDPNHPVSQQVCHVVLTVISSSFN